MDNTLGKAIMYTLKSRTNVLDRWTEEQFETLEELGQEMLYKTCNGWYCLIEPHEQEEQQ